MHVTLGQRLTAGEQVFVHGLLGTFRIARLDCRHYYAVLDQ
jgi:hypothetical protein